MLGGASAEREVSLRSGAAVAAALRSLGHAVHEVDPCDAAWTVPAGTDVVFLALHGTYGEDGTVQGRLDQIGIRYTGCDAAASRVAFDKVLTKQRCQALGVPTARYTVLRAATAAWPEGWAPPVVLKPVRQGSSVGLQMVDRREELAGCLAEALQHDHEVLMEERVLGREATVGILEERALPVIEVCPKQGVFDYANKYTKGATGFLVPAPFPPEVTRRVQEAALGAFRAVGGRDYGRVDVMVGDDGQPVVLEVNTLPGMTELSLLPLAAREAGLGFAALCERMVVLALGHRAGPGVPGATGAEGGG
jgi:D-alanine-D-alanine ligase